MSNTLILSIETSCDDTAISIVRSSDQDLQTCLPIGNVLASEVSSQIKLHAKWGGVVPNLAAREHLKNFPRLLEIALEEAKISPEQIDLIAITNGPGLIPALLVGVNYAKTLSYLWRKPLIGIHHIEGHIYANFIGTSNLKLNNKDSETIFPALALVVSGGHTQLILMKDHLQYEIVGQTVDDAVGEAFDKVARILGIGYPGGPVVSKYAENFAKLQAKQPMSNKLVLPRPMLNKKNFNFSFSGLKTAVLYETKKHPELLKDKKYIAEVCHEFQQATIDVLVAKTIRAAEQYNPKTILLAGGVSANTQLRKQLGEAITKNFPQTAYHIPQLEFTGDNAAMIATAAAFRWNKLSDTEKSKALDGWKEIQPDANLELK